MMPCAPCLNWLRKHKKAARWVAFFLALALGLSLAGRFNPPAPAEAGYCRIYY